MDNNIEYELAVMDSGTDSEESKSAAEWLAFNKLQIFPLLKSAGIALVLIEYCGNNYHRQMDEVSAFGPDTESGPGAKIVLPDANVTLRVPSFDDGNASESTFSLREAIEELCWTLLKISEDGWEKDCGGAGTFTLDVGSEHIELEHTEFFTVSDNSSHEW